MWMRGCWSVGSGSEKRNVDGNGDGDGDSDGG